MKPLVALVTLAGSLALGAAASAQSEAPQGGLPRHLHAPPHVYATYRAMAAGGTVVFIRHGKTEVRGNDATPLEFGRCDKQRNLSAAGIELSREMGESFRLLRIPVGRVLASPYCRTRETARLAFGRVEDERTLLVGQAETGWTMQDAGAALRRMAAIAPEPGTNTVLVAHIFNPLHAFQVRLEEGEALVMRPDGQGGARVVGRITAVQWGDLTRDYLTHGDKVFEMSAHDHGGDTPARPGHDTHHGR